jgi:hypothetical protein
VTENTSSRTEISSESSGEAVSTQWEHGFPKRWKLRFLASILYISLADQPATSIWGLHISGNRLIEDQEVTWIYNRVIGRSITRTEALSIVEAILKQAEKERDEIAAAEAKHWLWWEEGV